jgi:hypothetical protein
MNQGKRTPNKRRHEGAGDQAADLFHPDYTVGFGIAPNLLTSPFQRRALAGLRTVPLTAGGELHPALRSLSTNLVDNL